MSKNPLRFALLSLLLLMPTLLPAQPPLPTAVATAAPVVCPKYVFLFIGDGMSIPQRYMAEEYLKKTEQRGLRINAMPVQTLTTTSSANSFITDSAAAGTAIACGEKTNNGFIGVDPDGKRLESVAEVAKKSGRKVGIVTSVTLNHATPAAFYAHNASRGAAYDIGLDLIESGFDYFGGGGIEEANDDKAENYKGNLYELAKEKGYIVSQTQEGFRIISPGNKKVISMGSEGALPYWIDEKQKPEAERALRLVDFTRQAISQLDNENGFFIMVEGGSLDWACHANNAASALHEILEFDEAVGVALKFQEKNPDTLIVVTGDHETGGLTLGNRERAYSSNIELLEQQKTSKDAKEAKELAQKAGLGWTTGAHTALPVLTTAQGTAAFYFADAKDNTDIAKLLKQLIGPAGRLMRLVPAKPSSVPITVPSTSPIPSSTTP